jgi:HlyD family secretion protein
MRRIAIAVLAGLFLAGAAAFVWARWSGPAVGDVQPTSRSWLDSLAALVGLGGPDSGETFSGYVEAEYVLVTSMVGGTLMRLEVARGDWVTAGAPLFTLDDTAERGARDEAAARLAQAEAQLADLRLGRRAPEIDAILAQRDQAVAMLRQSEAEYERQLQLRRKAVSSQKAVDDARWQRDRDRAQVNELEAQLLVARLPGRDDQIRAAEAAVTAARAALTQAEWRLGQMTIFAPSTGTVSDTLFRPGETVGAGLPVVQLLPPANVKIRFFVPQAVVPQIAVGDAVRVTCDGCAAPIAATIRFISPQAEFTPPVIYSREERARLVFLVEAWPDAQPQRLRVGQPVDVTIVPRS